MNKSLRQEHYKGAANEHAAASWFLKRGFIVCWPFPQQSCIDFVVLKDKKFSTVQVKIATWSKTGNNKYLQCRTRLTNKYQNIKPSDLYDLMFIVCGNDCWIIPSEHIESSNISLSGKQNKWDIYKSKIVD